MNERHRLAGHLRAWGLSYREIGERLGGCSPGRAREMVVMACSELRSIERAYEEAYLRATLPHGSPEWDATWLSYRDSPLDWRPMFQ